MLTNQPTTIMLHNSCNVGTRGLPDIYTLGPAALVFRVYISGKPLCPCYNYIVNWVTNDL